MRYAHPRWCPVLRSGLGFRLVESIQPDASEIDSYFMQQHGVAGKGSRTEVYSGGQLAFRSTTTRVVLDGATVTGSIAGTHVGQRTQVSQANHYPGGGEAGVRTVDFIYDNSPGGYGFSFPTIITETRPTSTLTMTRPPVPANTTSWIAGLVDTEIHTSAGLVLRDIDHDYDAR